MEDLTNQLVGFLNSEEGKNQLGQALAMLSSQNTQTASIPSTGTPDISKLLAAVSGGQTNNTPPSSGPDIATVLSSLVGTGQQQVSPAPAQEAELSGLLSSLMGNLSSRTQSASPAGGSSQNAPDLTHLISLLTGSGENSSAKPQEKSSDFLSNLDLGKILKIQQTFSALGQSDKNTSLLLALKPHLEAQRQKKVDQAVLIMKILRILPMIADSGILGNLTGLLPSSLTGENNRKH